MLAHIDAAFANYGKIVFDNQASQAKLQNERLSEINETLYDEICLLEPFGEGNKEPIFEIKAEVADAKVLKEKHLSLIVRDDGGRELKAMWFSAPAEFLDGLKRGDELRMQFALMRNEWRGVVKIEGRIISLERCC